MYMNMLHALLCVCYFVFINLFLATVATVKTHLLCTCLMLNYQAFNLHFTYSLLSHVPSTVCFKANVLSQDNKVLSYLAECTESTHLPKHVLSHQKHVNGNA